ncbi:hypothetical protein ASPZODRAFT_36938, partial [Penicilliopsis zonata CBS 506.65]
RQALLDKLNSLLGGEPVPTPFWAVLIFSDIAMLEILVGEAEKSTFFLQFTMHACAALPLVWQQRLPQRPRSADSESFVSSSSHNSLNKSIRDKVIERDNEQCVITKNNPIEVAHIYPHYLLSGARTNLARTFPPFWEMLKYFWSEERVSQWHSQVFQDSESPEKQFDSVGNQICLSPSIHALWSLGRVAFWPLDYNDEKTTLEVEWHWQPPPPTSMDKTIAVNTVPSSSRGLNERSNPNSTASLSFIEQNGLARRIQTGDRFMLQTTDPRRLPLPSKELLDMQFVLNRIVNMSGAGDFE